MIWYWLSLALMGLSAGVAPEPELVEAIVVAAVEHPLPGPDGIVRMQAVLVAIAWKESRFELDALGDCRDPGTGKTIVALRDPRRTKSNCQSVGPWQVSKYWKRSAPGVEGEAELAARLVLESFRVCSKRPVSDRLGWYASGGGGCDRGLDASRNRMALARRLLVP